MTEVLKVRCFSHLVNLTDGAREAIIQAELDLLVSATSSSIRLTQRRVGNMIKCTITYTEVTQ